MKKSTKTIDWLFEEFQEDDFLQGKTSTSLPDIWEDEE